MDPVPENAVPMDLVTIEEIRQVKHRYLRCVDLKLWDVVRVAPFVDGKSTGKYDTFASMKGDQFRPVGLAVGKDGALFVSSDDDRKIWRIVKR